MMKILLHMMGSGETASLMDMGSISIRMATSIWETLKTDRRQERQSYLTVTGFTTKEKSSQVLRMDMGLKNSPTEMYTQATTLTTSFTVRELTNGATAASSKDSLKRE